MVLRPVLFALVVSVSAGCVGPKREGARKPDLATASSEFVAQGSVAHQVLVEVARPSGELPTGAMAPLQAAVEEAVAAAAPGHVRVVRDRAASGYVLATRVASLEVERDGRGANVRCSVTVRVGPQTGGQEHWREGQVANASGAGEIRASHRDIEEASRDCVLTVAQSVTTEKVVPFLRRSIRVAAR